MTPFNASTHAAPRPADGEIASGESVPPHALQLWELASAALTPIGVVDALGELVHANGALEALLARASTILPWLRQAQAPGSQRTCLQVPDHPTVELYLEARQGEQRLLFAWFEEPQTPAQDPLTGLGSRARFEQLVDNERYDALLLIDLDRFKQVNDTLGHGAGDQLLKLAAKRLTKAIRGQDPIVRLGGDEFAVFHAADDGGLTSAVAMGQRIIRLLSRPFLVDMQTVHVGASIGVASVSPGVTAREDLYRHADLALYAAKGAGGSSLRCFEQTLAQEAADRRSLETDLRQALVLGQMKLYYQPQVTTADGDLQGVEAILRWEHPERGDVAPEQFMSMAEEIGEIRAIGEWVLRRACAHAVTWPDSLSVAVNVASRQLDDPTFPDLLRRALGDSGLAAERLELEVTEAVLMSNSPVVLEHLMMARELGVSIALDEFGTGYSSLNYLNRFPFSRIKIARSFVHSQQHDARARNLVKCVLALGESLGISTMASGIETQEQCDAMRAIGCREGQGWLFGEPLTGEALDAYLRDTTSQR